MQIYTPLSTEKNPEDLPYIEEIRDWVKSYLGKPHRHLGRSGSVCPYVPQALNKNSIHLGVIRSQNLQQQQIEEIVLSSRELFLELEPKQEQEAIYKALLLIFPDIEIGETEKLIDGVQKKLKPFFVERGLMLGEFHQRNQTPGQHNPNFHPLQSPIPLIAIRFMVESDLPFLVNAPEPNLRIKYLEGYLNKFAGRFSATANFQNAQIAWELAKQQLQAQTTLL